MKKVLLAFSIPIFCTLLCLAGAAKTMLEGVM